MLYDVQYNWKAKRNWFALGLSMRVSQLLPLVSFVLAGILGSSGEAKAWGKFGHLTVCDLAYRNFTSTTRQELRKLLQVATGGITVNGRGELPERRYTSFNLGCLEEDELPRRHPTDHFINVDRETKSISTNVCPGNADCISSGIERDIATLKDIARYVSREDGIQPLFNSMLLRTHGEPRCPSD